MGAALGLLFGAGLVMMLSALLWPQQQKLRTSAPLTVRPRDLAIGLGLALLSGLVAAVLTGVPSAMLVAAVAGGIAPALIRRQRRAKLRQDQDAAWPDAVDMIRSGLRSGQSLPDAVLEVAERGPVSIRVHFAVFAQHYQAGGGFEAAVIAMQAATNHAIADRVCVTLLMGAQQGGREVPRMITTLSQFLREDRRLRGEIEGRQSWTVAAARIAVAAPWVALLLLSTRGNAAQAYASPAGSVLIAATAVLSVLAYLAMRQIAKLPGPVRIGLDR